MKPEFLPAYRYYVRTALNWSADRSLRDGRRAVRGRDTICIDHDHDCCPEEKRSCGGCVRGLLCVSCNTALGIIESKLPMAREYVSSRPVVGLSSARLLLGSQCTGD